MIQRIQSVYFLLAGILPAFSFCVPMARYFNGNAELAYTMNAFSLTAVDGGVTKHPWGVMVFTVLSIIFAFVCIFSFKNRMKQIAWSSILLTLILLGALTYVAYGYSYGGDLGLRFLPSWGLLFPVLSFVFAILGRKAVRKDEELVRAADRIR